MIKISNYQAFFNLFANSIQAFNYNLKGKFLFLFIERVKTKTKPKITVGQLIVLKISALYTKCCFRHLLYCLSRREKEIYNKHLRTIIFHTLILVRSSTAVCRRKNIFYTIVKMFVEYYICFVTKIVYFVYCLIALI